MEFNVFSKRLNKHAFQSSNTKHIYNQYNEWLYRSYVDDGVSLPVKSEQINEPLETKLVFSKDSANCLLFSN